MALVHNCKLGKPAKDFLESLTDEDRSAVAENMREVSLHGLIAARHVRGGIYEVRITGQRSSYRLFFASEGKRSQVFLALVGFTKRTQKTPIRQIDLAQQRLNDWRNRGIQIRRRTENG
ncbi:MAG: type II toxin-antitoxin system RelE/ParE family toxin [Ilumatobacteraceae bacterium]